MGFFLNSRVKFLDPWNLPDLPVIAGLWFATELQPRCRWHFRESGSFQEVAQRYCSWANLGLVSWLADVYRTRIQGWTGSQWHVRPLRAFTLWGCFTVEIARASPAPRPTAYGMSGWCISAVTSMEKLSQQRLAWSCCLLHVTTTDQDHWALKTTEALQAREREREKEKWKMRNRRHCRKWSNLWVHWCPNFDPCPICSSFLVGQNHGWHQRCPLQRAVNPGNGRRSCSTCRLSPLVLLAHVEHAWIAGAKQCELDYIGLLFLQRIYK